MEQVDKGCPMIRMCVSGCFFWYWPTRVVLDQRPLNGCVCMCVLQQTVNQTMLYSANPHTKFNQFEHANSVQMVDSVRSSRQQKDHVCHILDT